MYKESKIKHFKLAFLSPVGAGKSVTILSSTSSTFRPDFADIHGASSAGIPISTNLEYDLESLNPHYLEKVNRLINRLKLGELSRGEVKGLKSNNILKKQLELRDDQVRVIFYPLTDNNYIIVGVLTKKKDNDNDGYSKMAFRNKKIDISTEEKYIKEQERSKEVEERYTKFIEDKKRKGTSR